MGGGGVTRRHQCINEYLTIDNSDIVSVNSLHAVTAVWLNTSQRRHVGVGLNRSARRTGYHLYFTELFLGLPGCIQCNDRGFE